MSQMAEATAEMTIDALARETGMTVRNIRAHQSRGLLPPPQVRARTGSQIEGRSVASARVPRTRIAERRSAVALR